MYLSSCTKFVFEDKEIGLDLLVGDVYDENNGLKFACVCSIVDPFIFLGKEEVVNTDGEEILCENMSYIDGKDINDIIKAVFTIETCGNWFSMEIDKEDLYIDLDWCSHDNSIFRATVIVEDTSKIKMIHKKESELQKELDFLRSNWIE